MPSPQKLSAKKYHRQSFESFRMCLTQMGDCVPCREGVGGRCRMPSAELCAFVWPPTANRCALNYVCFAPNKPIFCTISTTQHNLFVEDKTLNTLRICETTLIAVLMLVSACSRAHAQSSPSYDRMVERQPIDGQCLRRSQAN